MNIGEKIKKLRTAKLMTQSDLVGNEITRNMLSRIENGAANPSLDTIYYIAERLKVSPSYLLSDGDDELVLVKNSRIHGIKKAFMNEDYRICKDMCETSECRDDDEVRMILCECDLAIAVEEFHSGHLHLCAELLDEAIEGCVGTLYRTDYVIAAAAVYFRYMQRISATVSSNIIDETEVNVYPAMTDEFCRYALLLEGADDETLFGTKDIAGVGREDSPYVKHLLAMNCMINGDFSQAYSYLHGILLGEFSVPQPTLYFIFCDLEVCCRELGDFKGAYEYSLDKLELLQRLLS